MSDIRYDGRVAIVTGAGAGLGRQYALYLASRGAKVLVNDLSEPEGRSCIEAIRSAGGEGLLHVGSVVEAGAAMVAAAIERWGRIDIIVSNAGVLRDAAFHRMGADAFELVLRVHLHGAFAVVRAAWPHMREAGYGRVVLITSANGLYGAFGQANYSTAKAAMVGFAKTLASEGSSKGIKVNTLAPGGGTAMTATVLPPELVAKWKAEYAVPCLAYLCSEELDASGRVFEAAGGWMAEVRWHRSPGAFFDIERGFSVEDVRDAWGRITDFSDAGSPEEEGTATGLGSPQLKQVLAKL